jgi:hypothetical protein
MFAKVSEKLADSTFRAEWVEIMARLCRQPCEDFDSGEEHGALEQNVEPKLKNRRARLWGLYTVCIPRGLGGSGAAGLSWSRPPAV